MYMLILNKNLNKNGFLQIPIPISLHSIYHNSSAFSDFISCRMKEKLESETKYPDLR